MKRILPLFLLIPLVGLSQAGKTGLKSPEIHYHEKVNSPKYIKFRAADAPSFSSFTNYAREAFGMRPEDDLKEYSAESDRIGYTHHRYQQLYKSYPVEWAIYIVHEKQGKIQSLNGLFHANITPSNSIRLNEGEAIQSASKHIGAARYKWEIPAEEQRMRKILNKPDFSFYPRPQLVVLPIENSSGYSYRYAYKIDIYAHEPEGRWNVYVDAQTGEVLRQLSLIHETEVTGTAKTRYSGIQTIKTDSMAPDSFRLRETSRGGGIETYNLRNSTNPATAVDFYDNDNNWENFNAARDEVATDAHWGAEVTYDYFKNVLGRDSYDNMGGKLISYVHFGAGVVNAFWNGYYMSYGDGGSGYSPLTSLDICGHELAHGVTGNSAGLIYASESGALNESFSDIFGNTIEKFAKPSVAKWRVGEEINNGSGLRNMSNPNDFTDPDTYEGLHWIKVKNCNPSGGNDNCGVHTNSGVQNFWYYLLVEGGSGKNDKDSTYSVSGIGFDKASQIAYRNLTVYLTPTSGYLDAAFYSIQSARDLFGDNSNEVEQTTNAWFAVGIGKRYTALPVADFTLEETYCSTTAYFRFLNTSGSASDFKWDFGDGTTSTDVNPLHKFPAPGTYTVKLIAINGNGTDTLVKTNYINIYPDNTKPSTCQAQTVSTSPSSGIYNFTLNTINNSSSDASTEGGYKDFACMRTNLNIGTAYPLTITTNTTSSVFTRVWVDLNNDGNFVFPGELLFSTNSTIGTHTGTITLPSGTVQGTPIRLRITEGIAIVNVPDNPCNPIRLGQIEDYSIIAMPPVGISHVKQEEASIKVFPNPSNGKVRISAKKHPYIRVTVSNILGNKVFFMEKAGPSETTEIDLSKEKKGLYFIQIESENISEVTKILLL
jgi:Zn-dependent metalloprotease